MHLLHAVIENAHAATVPSHPHLPADILRRRFVKGSLDLHKAVPAHVAPGLLIAWKERGRLQMGAFLLKACGDLFAGRAVNAFVGDVLFPWLRKAFSSASDLKRRPFKRVAANVGHPALHLPLVLGHPRTAGHHVDVVMAAKSASFGLICGSNQSALSTAAFKLSILSRSARRQNDEAHLSRQRNRLGVLAHHRFTVALARVAGTARNTQLRRVLPSSCSNGSSQAEIDLHLLSGLAFDAPYPLWLPSLSRRTKRLTDW